MKKNRFTTAFISFLLLAAVMSVSSAEIKRSSAYFTAYDSASGSKEIRISEESHISEDVNGMVKTVTVTNDSESTAFARIKPLAGSQIGYEYNGEDWTYSDGYIYYNKPLSAKSSTSTLTLTIKPAEDFKDDFNFVVVEETVIANFDEDDNPYAQWDAEVIEG